jgi:FkbM family methyltransferase
MEQAADQIDSAAKPKFPLAEIVAGLPPERRQAIEELSRTRNKTIEQTVDHLAKREGLFSVQGTKHYRPSDSELSCRFPIADILENIPPKRFEAIEMMAEMRGDSVEATAEHLLKFAGLFTVQGARKRKWLLPPANFTFKSLEEDGPLHATITLTNGRILTGYASGERFVPPYHCLKDKLPVGVTLPTYEVYVDSYRRYHQAVSAGANVHIPMPGEGGVFVDAGAYIGFKAIGFADYVGERGRSILIEIGEDNAQLARRNIAQNKLESRVQAFHCGVWNTNGTAPDRVRDRSTHTLAQTNEHSYAVNNLVVQTRTLDSIFTEAGVDRIDLLNLQLNGAEPEAIDGLVEHFDKVRFIRAAAMFTGNGETKMSILSKKLRDRGCWVLENPKTIFAVPEPYRKQFGV